MGCLKNSLPPVPEDQETRPKNRVRNKEEMHLKDVVKAKKANKAKAVEDLAKRCREARKAGLPEPESRRPPFRKGEKTPNG
jgi:hypothetical protein